jgi:hypothetical protein
MSVYTNPGSSAPAAAAAYVAALLDLLGDQDPVAVLRQTPRRIHAMIDTVSPDLATRPEAPGKWSVRDVVQHLNDCELVAGFRLRMILAHDRPQLIGFDQDLWAEHLRYSEVDLADAMAQFESLRRGNLRLWEGMTPNELARVGIHAERGEESLEHLRRLYASHDLMHLRQLERIRGVLSATRV